jgi:hypothetical protein
MVCKRWECGGGVQPLLPSRAVLGYARRPSCPSTGARRRSRAPLGGILKEKGREGKGREGDRGRVRGGRDCGAVMRDDGWGGWGRSEVGSTSRATAELIRDKARNPTARVGHLNAHLISTTECLHTTAHSAQRTAHTAHRTPHITCRRRRRRWDTRGSSS